MEHCGYVVKVEHLREHSNADRLMVATFFGNDTIVGKDTHIGDMGVYFPSDLQLSERFCAVNDLVRRKDENGKQVGGYLDPEKRNIKAIKLRGEKSDGLYLPIVALADFTKISELKVGDPISVLNGEEICCKYIPKRQYSTYSHGEKIQKAKVDIAPTFYEHIDTQQLAYNLGAFKQGDIVEVTIKMHGTSGRTGYLPLLHTKRSWLDKLLHRHGKDYYEYGYVTGTRRVVLAEGRQGGFYESDDFRHAMAAKFEGKLHKGEVAYYEIVGFQGPNGAPIMAEVKNSKVKDPEFSKQYGDTTIFSYGCNQKNGYEETYETNAYWDDHNAIPALQKVIGPCCEIYVYRMTMVSEDGSVVEYSPTQMHDRCEQMGVKCVPQVEIFTIPYDEIDYHQDGNGNFYADPEDYHIVNPREYALRKAENWFDGPDPIGKTHIREGVVLRILNRSKFEVYKHKNFSFKVLEGIAKDEATAPDLEEAQEIQSDV